MHASPSRETTCPSPGWRQAAAHTADKESDKPQLRKLLSGCRSTNKEEMRRLCRGSLPLKAEIQAILCIQSRQTLQPRIQLAKDARGSGGKRFFASPRRLCAAFDARKRLPSNNTDKFQRRNPPAAEDRTHNSPRDSFAPRGSLILRRAKAASEQQCRTTPKEKATCSRVWDFQLRKDRPKPLPHAAESSTAK